MVVFTALGMEGMEGPGLLLTPPMWEPLGPNKIPTIYKVAGMSCWNWLGCFTYLGDVSNLLYLYRGEIIYLLSTMDILE